MHPGNDHDIRLFVDAPLSAGARVACTSEQVNYLLNVLRLKAGDTILAFNGRDGEWRAELADVAKRRCILVCRSRTRVQLAGPDLHYLFAPLKHGRLDYMVQKATELGVAHLQPVITHRTVASRVNLERMRANVIEAAEQCGVLRLPAIGEPKKLEALLAAWPQERRIVFCDESAPVASPLAALAQLKPGPLAVLVGPEGGFDVDEQALIRSHTNAVVLSLGPRIMRADTAAVAALALVNAALGDWC